MKKKRTKVSVGGLILAAILLLGAPPSRAESTPPPGPVASPAPAVSAPAPVQDTKPAAEEKPRMEIYGAAMLDMGYQTGQNDPNWFDVLRPTKLPSYEGEYGADGRYSYRIIINLAPPRPASAT